MRNAFDKSFDELIKKKYIEDTDVGPDEEPIFRLTDKAVEQDRYQAELRKALANNSPTEILMRFANSN